MSRFWRVQRSAVRYSLGQLLGGVLLWGSLTAWMRYVYVTELTAMPEVLAQGIALVWFLCLLVWVMCWFEELCDGLVSAAMSDLYPGHRFTEGRFRTSKLQVLRIHWEYCRASPAARETFLALVEDEERPVTLELFRVAAAATAAP